MLCSSPNSVVVDRGGRGGAAARRSRPGRLLPVAGRGRAPAPAAGDPEAPAQPGARRQVGDAHRGASRHRGAGRHARADRRARRRRAATTRCRSKSCAPCSPTTSWTTGARAASAASRSCGTAAWATPCRSTRRTSGDPRVRAAQAGVPHLRQHADDARLDRADDRPRSGHDAGLRRLRRQHHVGQHLAAAPAQHQARRLRAAARDRRRAGAGCRRGACGRRGCRTAPALPQAPTAPRLRRGAGRRRSPPASTASWRHAAPAPPPAPAGAPAPPARRRSSSAKTTCAAAARERPTHPGRRANHRDPGRARCRRGRRRCSCALDGAAGKPRTPNSCSSSSVAGYGLTGPLHRRASVSAFRPACDDPALLARASADRGMRGQPAGRRRHSAATGRCRCPRRRPRRRPSIPWSPRSRPPSRPSSRPRRMPRATSRDARVAFDQALDTARWLCPAAPGPSRGCASTSTRLVDRISVLEQAALANGDGFTETASEPAIDRHPAVAAADRGRGRAGARSGHDGAGRPGHDGARHPDSDQRPRAALRRAVPGPAARVPHRRPVARRAVPADDPGHLPRRRACRSTWRTFR